jgi:type II secretory pathway component PulF
VQVLEHADDLRHHPRQQPRHHRHGDEAEQQRVGQRGEDLLLQEVALRLIASGERSGQLPRMLDEAASQQQRELDRWLTALTAILGPAVILAVGAVVLFIVLAILLPIFNLNQMVR